MERRYLQIINMEEKLSLDFGLVPRYQHKYIKISISRFLYQDFLYTRMAYTSSNTAKVCPTARYSTAWIIPLYQR